MGDLVNWVKNFVNFFRINFSFTENNKLFLDKNSEKDSENYIGKVTENKRPSSMPKDKYIS